jgi:hypothetical protein
MAETILFPHSPPAHWVDKRECVWFPAVFGSRNLSCLASAELLMERFGMRSPGEQDAMRAYEMHKARLQAMARAQILAGKISPENEVLLTRESFAFKEVRFSEGVRRSSYYFRLVRQMTAELEEAAEQSAGRTTVEWDLAEDTEGRPLYVLIVRDSVAQVSLVCTPEQLERERERRASLSRAWGNLLQERNHRQLQELRGAGQSEG